jgi:hypothetical protein
VILHSKGSVEVFADGLVTEHLDLELFVSGQIDIDDLRADDVGALISKGKGGCHLKNSDKENQALCIELNQLQKTKEKGK